MRFLFVFVFLFGLFSCGEDKKASENVNDKNSNGVSKNKNSQIVHIPDAKFKKCLIENKEIKSKSHDEQKRIKQYSNNKNYLTEDDQDKVGKSVMTVDVDKETIIEFNTAMSGITNQNNLHVKVAFPRQGPKWFLVKHAQLELLNE